MVRGFKGIYSLEFVTTIIDCTDFSIIVYIPDTISDIKSSQEFKYPVKYIFDIIEQIIECNSDRNFEIVYGKKANNEIIPQWGYKHTINAEVPNHGTSRIDIRGPRIELL